MAVQVYGYGGPYPVARAAAQGLSHRIGWSSNRAVAAAFVAAGLAFSATLYPLPAKEVATGNSGDRSLHQLAEGGTFVTVSLGYRTLPVPLTPLPELLSLVNLVGVDVAGTPFQGQPSAGGFLRLIKTYGPYRLVSLLTTLNTVYPQGIPMHGGGGGGVQAVGIPDLPPAAVSNLLDLLLLLQGYQQSGVLTQALPKILRSMGPVAPEAATPPLPSAFAQEVTSLPTADEPAAEIVSGPSTSVYVAPPVATVPETPASTAPEQLTSTPSTATTATSGAPESGAAASPAVETQTPQPVSATETVPSTIESTVPTSEPAPSSHNVQTPESPTAVPSASQSASEERASGTSSSGSVDSAKPSQTDSTGESTGGSTAGNGSSPGTGGAVGSGSGNGAGSGSGGTGGGTDAGGAASKDGGSDGSGSS